MLANYHTHTYRCNHAKGEDREYVENAIKGGMKILGFSDHCPWVFDNGFESGTRMKNSEIDGYFKSLTDLKKEYEKDIKIYIGFESEYIPELMEKQDELLKDYQYDYMILGEHFVNDERVSSYTGFPTDNVNDFKLFVDTTIEAVNSGRYKYIAHPDIFNFVGDREIYIREYTRLCKAVKEKDMPLEINLLGLRDGRHYPNEMFWEIAKSVGNKAIIGCDAHWPEVLSTLSEMEKCQKFAEKYNLEVVDVLDGLGL